MVRKRSKSVAEILLMKDLYQRLRRVGFDQGFFGRRNLLPDWWDDSLATVPSNRAMAEASIARMLGFTVSALRDQKQELELPAVSEFRLKRVKKTYSPNEIAPAVLLAYQAARSVLRVTPIAVRGATLGEGRQKHHFTGSSIR